MLSLVAPIASTLPFPSSPNPLVMAMSSDSGLSVMRLGKSQFRLSGRVGPENASQLFLQLSDDILSVSVLPGESAEDVYQKLKRVIPQGFQAFSRRLRDGAVEVSIVQLQPEVMALPEVHLLISDDVQQASPQGLNGFEVLGISAGKASDMPASAQLTVDGRTIFLRLRKGMTPAETARALIQKLPAGYQASLEASRIPGAPATVRIVRGSGIDRAAA